MLRVLHLAGCQDSLQTLRSSQLLCSALGREFPAARRSIGRGGDYRNAAHAAISLRFASRPEFDLIHAWDTTALIAALGATLPTVFSPEGPLTGRMAPWMRIAAPRETVHVIAATPAQRASLLRLGAAAERCHVVPPAMDSRGLLPMRNQRLREQLGFAPDDYVVVAPGESNRVAEHSRAVWATSILHVLDDRWRLLLWGRGRDLGVAQSLAKRLRQRRLLVIAEQKLGRSVEFEELLGVADAAIFAGRGDLPIIPMLLCMAAGLPIVAADGPLVRELLHEGKTALVASGGAPRSLARALLRLREDRKLARRLADAAASDVAARFSSRPFVDRMRQIYWAAGMTGGDPPPSARCLDADPAN